MALDPAKLVEKMDQKAAAILGLPYTANSTEMKEKLFKVIAESVIEHFQENAEVKVLIVGSDAGAALGASTVADNIEGKILVHDVELNTAIAAVVASGNIPASFVLRNSGFVK